MHKMLLFAKQCGKAGQQGFNLKMQSNIFKLASSKLQQQIITYVTGSYCLLLFMIFECRVKTQQILNCIIYNIEPNKGQC